MKSLFIFDIDETLNTSEIKIEDTFYSLFDKLNQSNYDLALIGKDKYLNLKNKFKNISFQYIFSNSGSICYFKNEKKYENILIEQEIFSYFHLFIKKSFQYLYSIMNKKSGYYIDIFNGFLYISFTPLLFNQSDYTKFSDKDKKFEFRKKLIKYLENLAENLGIQDQLSIKLKGNYGIMIYPKIWGKSQIINEVSLNKYEHIYYFIDKSNLDEFDIIDDNNISFLKIESFDDIKKNIEQIL